MVIDGQSKNVLRDLERELDDLLSNAGIFFRLFSRIKEQSSIEKKLIYKRAEKGEKYKMQDYLGFRIVLYFKDDIDLVKKILSTKYQELDTTVDTPKDNEFSPVRINYVFLLPSNYDYLIPDNFLNKVDKSFEIQIRTIFSEGWHEVEHDFRYKCRNDWEEYQDLSRVLNGIFATLENCDWAIIKLFDDLSYKNYKNKEWEKMLKNKFRLRFTDAVLSKEIVEFFNNNADVVKKVFKSNRYKLVEDFSTAKIPFAFDNIVYYTFLREGIEPSLEIPILIKELYEATNK